MTEDAFDKLIERALDDELRSEPLPLSFADSVVARVAAERITQRDRLIDIETIVPAILVGVSALLLVGLVGLAAASGAASSAAQQFRSQFPPLPIGLIVTCCAVFAASYFIDPRARNQVAPS